MKIVGVFFWIDDRRPKEMVFCQEGVDLFWREEAGCACTSGVCTFYFTSCVCVYPYVAVSLTERSEERYSRVFVCEGNNRSNNSRHNNDNGNNNNTAPFGMTERNETARGGASPMVEEERKRRGFVAAVKRLARHENGWFHV